MATKYKTCHWCESSRLEPRQSENELTRLSVCLDCGAETRSSIQVTVKNLLGLIRQNKKITAIKLHRISAGVGLQEAKEFIEELANYG